ADAGLRMRLRKRAAEIQKGEGDREGMRQSLLAALEDGEDAETLRLLAEDAEAQGDAREAAEFFGRLVDVAPQEERVELALRQARLLAKGAEDLDAAIERYRWIHKELAP